MSETYYETYHEICLGVLSAGTDPAAAEIAYCGLYCVECRWLTEGKCRSCRNDPRNSICPIYRCASERGEESCLLCDTHYYKECPTWRKGILSIHHRMRWSCRRLWVMSETRMNGMRVSRVPRQTDAISWQVAILGTASFAPVACSLTTIQSAFGLFHRLTKIGSNLASAQAVPV